MSDRIDAYFFDRVNDRFWRWNLPDPPPPVVQVPKTVGPPRRPYRDSDAPVGIEVVNYHRRYFIEGVDKRARVVYTHM